MNAFEMVARAKKVARLVTTQVTCSCPNVRAWRRSYGASWLSVLLSRCWDCDRRWRARMHIAGVAFCYLIAPAAVLGVVVGLWLAVRP